MAVRGLGVALHLGNALVSGRLAGRLGGERFSCPAAGLVLMWLTWLHPVPWFGSAEYAEARAIRPRAATSRLYAVDGVASA